MESYEHSLIELLCIYAQLMVLDVNSVDCRMFNSAIQVAVEALEEAEFIQGIEYVIQFLSKVQKDKNINKQYLLKVKQVLFELTADYKDLQKKIK